MSRNEVGHSAKSKKNEEDTPTVSSIPEDMNETDSPGIDSLRAAWQGKATWPDLESIKYREHVDQKCSISLKDGGKIFSGDINPTGRSSSLTAKGIGSKILIGAGTSLNGCNILSEGSNCTIIIGDQCRLKNLIIRCRHSNSCVIIGRGATVESATFLSESGDVLLIGDDCMLSNGIMIRTSDGHGIFDLRSGAMLNASANVIVDRHVWIGNGVRVNKGCVIGKGTIIGQGSVVSGIIDESCIYAGIPARKIKSGVAWSRTYKFEDVPEEFRMERSPK